MPSQSNRPDKSFLDLLRSHSFPSEELAQILQTDRRQTPASSHIFVAAIERLRRPLMALTSLTTGVSHPDFPKTILAFHLLTEKQLDSLARYYHQVCPPLPETNCYPIRIRPWIGSPQERTMNMNQKRQLFGEFIGLNVVIKSLRDVAAVTRLLENAFSGAEVLRRIEKAFDDVLRKVKEEENYKGYY